MQARKVMICFIIFIFLGILIHLIIQYFRSSVSDEDSKPAKIFIGKQIFSNKEKFTKLANAIDVHCHENISMIILVLCQTKDRALRETIRHTWGQWISSNYSRSVPQNLINIHYHSKNIRLFFVIGSKTTDKVDVDSELIYLYEESRFNDIMFFPGLKDSYMNLTLKTLTSLNSALNSCRNATYFLKVDTDVFLNVPLLINFCKKYLHDAQRRPLIFGNEQVRAPVIRDQGSKWYVPKSKYVQDYFPNYVTGCGYILNRLATISVINTASAASNLFDWEDVAVTGIYSTNVSIVDTKLFRYESFMASVDGCFMKIIILAHRISLKKMASLWNEMVTGNTLCPPSATQLYDMTIKALSGT